MGLCLRGKLADAGILPQQAPAVAATDAAASATEENEAASTPAVIDAPTEVGEPTLDVDPADDIVAATFGLLRAEPDGSVVIAGSGAPGTEVEVYSGDALLGKATVESNGDWVLVPDEPIAPGGTEITLAEAGKSGRADQSFVVVINEDKSSEPLVVASTPGAASEVLQGLDRPIIETEAQLAAADPVSQPAPPAATAPAPASAAAPVAPAAPAGPAAVPPASATATAPAAPEPETEPSPAPAASAQISAPATSPATAAGPETSATAAPTTEPVPAAPTPASPVPAATEAPVTASAEATPMAPPAAAAPATAIAAVQPTIDAIEIEGERTFFAGAGQEGATMRLYVDDTFIADATVTDGRWLVEAGNVLTKPEQRVRVDMLEAGNAEVAARAEVDFRVDVPAEIVTDVAQAPTPTTPAPAAETIPTMVGISVGDPDAERFASGKAIIRRGDNLWTIARRVYGDGVKYTTIYEANTGQIRDPDWIYPGQVFDLPN